MGRSPLSRVAGFLFAMLVGLYAPGLAFAHGYAHHSFHEDSEHEGDHHEPEFAGVRPAVHSLVSVEIGAAHDSEDHAHPQVSNAVSVRADLKVFVVPEPAANFPTPIEVADDTSLLLTAAPARAGPPGAPPRQPRAPPLG